MAFNPHIVIIQTNLRKLESYERVVLDDQYTSTTIDELKANAIGLLQDIGQELQAMRDEVQGWTT